VDEAVVCQLLACSATIRQDSRVIRVVRPKGPWGSEGRTLIVTLQYSRFAELRELFDRLKSGTPNQPDDFTGVFFTNFGWHTIAKRARRHKALQGRHERNQ
jgi:hypothetical protein